MMRNGALFLLLAAVLVLPFALRPSSEAPVVSGKTDTVVIISPHNEAIRYEFETAFRNWYRSRLGREVRMDWRLLGGTSEITRYLEGEYSAAFRNFWTGELGRKWSTEVEAGFANGRLRPDASAEAKEARAAFLASEVGCGIDVFFGGGTFDFVSQARAGRLVPMVANGAPAPEWMREEIVPLSYAGDDFRDAGGRWTGAVLSSFGIVYNRDVLDRLGLPAPKAWADLTDPRYLGEVALADPTKSGSMNKAFEIVVQQRMHAVVDTRLAAARAGDLAALPKVEQAAVAEGWSEGLRLLLQIAANSRYFTDNAQKVPIDVAAGNCAVGMGIDFYGRQQVESLAWRSGSERVAYVSPAGGTVYSVDPIGVLRGAPHPDPARALLDFVLSVEGQRLWNQKPGTPGGPERYALRRLPVRKDMYGDNATTAWLSDPQEKPYALENPLIYRPEWTGALFGELRFILRVMCLDAHPELTASWREIVAAGCPPRAMAVFTDVSVVDYAAAQGKIRAALRSKDKIEELRLARELGEHFRAQYRRAAAVARGEVN